MPVTLCVLGMCALRWGGEGVCVVCEWVWVVVVVGGAGVVYCSIEGCRFSQEGHGEMRQLEKAMNAYFYCTLNVQTQQDNK